MTVRHVQNHKQINHAYIFLVIGRIFNVLMLLIACEIDVYNTFRFCGNDVPTDLRI